MCLVFQKILLFHTNILIPNTHPYVWFKLKFKFGLRVMSVLKCLHYPYTYKLIVCVQHRTFIPDCR